MSRATRKPVFGVSDQVDTNQAVQPQKIARGLKILRYSSVGSDVAWELRGTKIDPGVRHIFS